MAVDAIPRHLGQQNGEPAPAGAAGKGQASTEEGAEKNPVGIHREGEDRAGQNAEADGELYLLHERKDL